LNKPLYPEVIHSLCCLVWILHCYLNPYGIHQLVIKLSQHFIDILLSVHRDRRLASIQITGYLQVGCNKEPRNYELRGNRHHKYF